MQENEISRYNDKLRGANLAGETLKEVIDSEQIIILHFLRHLGCMYCKYTVDQLYELVRKTPKFPKIIFVHQGTPEEGDDFFSKHFPNASHISDPKLGLYSLFKINRLEGVSWFHPKMILKGIKILSGGYSNNLIGQDVKILSGTFLFNKGKLIWQHRAKYAGDDPQWSKLF